MWLKTAVFLVMIVLDTLLFIYLLIRVGFEVLALATVNSTAYPEFNGIMGEGVSSIAECPYLSQTLETDTPDSIFKSILNSVGHSSLAVSCLLFFRP
jgi:hypothetical protein